MSKTIGGRSRTWWVCLFLAVGLLGAAGLLSYRHLAKPLVNVPVPANPAALDPMLFAYVQGQVAWVRQSPCDARRQATLGLVYAANGLWSEARQAFSNTVLLDPNEPLALLYLAVAHQELGQTDRAIDHLRELTRRFPQFAPGYARLGDYSLRVGALDEAQSAFRKLIELAPKEWRGFAGLGEVLLRKGEAAPAAQLLEQAVQLDATAKPAHALLGQAYQVLGRPADAQRELARGLNAMHYAMPDPWSEQAPRHMRLVADLLDLAQGHIQSGNPAAAVQVLEMALPYHPQNQSLLITLAQACTLSGQPQKALPLIGRALQALPGSVSAYVVLSGAELALGQTERALSNAIYAVSLATNRSDAYVAKANALLAVDRDADAAAALQEAHGVDPNNAQILLDHGDICLRNLNAPQAALADYREAVTVAPLLLPAHLRLINLYLRMGDKRAAAECLKSAHELAPNDADITAALTRLQTQAPP